MLECYLDDAGTHGNSRAIVWGGVAGDHRFFQQLESEWKARLADPCDGRKPPIKAFHSSHLIMGVKEFEGYNQAERDLTRRNFRKIVTDLGLTFVTGGISVDAWKKISTPHPLGKVYSAESFVFAYIVKHTCHSAKEHGDPIAFHFDQGRFAELASSIKPAINASDLDEQYVSYTFSSVGLNMGLQAADLVAHETYRYFEQFIGNTNAAPDAHLRKLIEGVHDYSDCWFGENEIRTLFEKTGEDINLMSLLDDPSSGE